MDTKILINKTFKKNLPCWLWAAVKQDHHIERLFSGFTVQTLQLQGVAVGCAPKPCNAGATWLPVGTHMGLTWADLSERQINWLRRPQCPARPL